MKNWKKKEQTGKKEQTRKRIDWLERKNRLERKTRKIIDWKEKKGRLDKGKLDWKNVKQIGKKKEYTGKWKKGLEKELIDRKERIDWKNNRLEKK